MSSPVLFTIFGASGDLAKRKLYPSLFRPFDPAKLAGGDYSFFCSFPGHEGLMHGTVKLVD